MIHLKNLKGFTLAELLIAMAILGVIATFTIPKILSSSANGQNNAIAKETIAMVSGAFQQYQLSNTVSASTESKALTQYMNYVNVDTSSIVDNTPGYGTHDCYYNICLTLHNGAKLVIDDNESFGGTATDNGLHFTVDPDGTTSANKGLTFFVLYNGRITTGGQCVTSVTSSVSTYPCAPSQDPTWFSW